MWLPLALIAMSTLVLRRSTEKHLTSRISAGSMAWLQQVAAVPFMLALLPFARFYLPGQLSGTFYAITIFYVLAQSVDVILYFKAIEVGDISIIAPLLTLTSVGSLFGAFFVLGQVPTFAGILGAALIVTGAYLTTRKSRTHVSAAINNRLAIAIILFLVVFRGFYASFEVISLRLTNPIYFNFVTSLLGIPLVMLLIYLRGRHTGRPLVSRELLAGVRRRWLGFLFVGLTYTIAFTATFAAKLASPDAGYVTAIRNAQVLPLVLVGVFFFHEHVQPRQWLGVGFLLAGLACYLRV